MALVFLWVQEEARIRAHKIFTWKHLTIWRPVLLGFSQSTGCLFFWIPPWTPFRECWGLAACSGHDVIFVGAAFSQQGPFKATIWLCFGGIYGHCVPRGWKNSFPGLGKIPLTGSSVCCYWTGPCESKSFWIISVLLASWSRKIFPLVAAFHI